MSPATSAFEPHLAHRPSSFMPASRTAESVRPAQAEQIVAAGLFAGEARLEFKQISWIILHKVAYYILGSPESSGYPVAVNRIAQLDIVFRRGPFGEAAIETGAAYSSEPAGVFEKIQLGGLLAQQLF